MYDENWCAWVAMEERLPLHEAALAEWHGYAELRAATESYLESAKECVKGSGAIFLDRKASQRIVETLGPPPPVCLPIYIMTVADRNEEQVVYIGKTITTTRFANGHAAMAKLHAPEYRDHDKYLYRCCVCFHFNNEYVPLEWIEPDTLARSLLDSVESQLIHQFQPPLNTDKKEAYRAKKPFVIHIQNLAGSQVLNDRMVFPPA